MANDETKEKSHDRSWAMLPAKTTYSCPCCWTPTVVVAMLNAAGWMPRKEVRR